METYVYDRQTDSYTNRLLTAENTFLKVIGKLIVNSGVRDTKTYMSMNKKLDEG